MKISLAAAGVLLAASLTAPAWSQSLIAIDGSSTVYPTTEAVAEEFQKHNRGMRVTVGISGTGGGFRKFCRGETVIQNASRPIVESEMRECGNNNVRYVEVPVAFDALTVVVNPRNTWATCMTVQELRTLWEPTARGTIMNWNQVRASWPDRRITLYGAGSDSGTFDYFTEAVMGRARASRTDYTASEDDNVLVQGISRDQNALGYLPFSYVAGHANQMRAIAVDNGAGCVAPTQDNVINGTYAPLSRPLFIYVNVTALNRPEVNRFVEFYLSSAGQRLIQEVKYVPLPQTAYDVIINRVRNQVAGTAFGGHAQMGLNIQQIVERTPAE